VDLTLVRLGVHVIVDAYQLGNPIAANPNYLSGAIPGAIGVHETDGEQGEGDRKKPAINQGPPLVGCPEGDEAAG
jgi:hypothetical protein